MTLHAEAIAVRCERCGGALALDLGQHQQQCGHCGAWHTIQREEERRAREHLQRLAQLRDQAGRHASEVDYYRRIRRPGRSLLGVLLLNVLMVGGGWLWFWGRTALTRAWGAVLANLLMVPVGLVGLLAVLIGWPVFLSYRRSRDVSFEQPLGRAGCPQCGADLPVVMGHALRCPFCESELLPQPTVQLQAEKLGTEVVERLAHEEQQSRQAYEQYIQRAVERGQAIGSYWAAICIGSLVGPLVLGLVVGIESWDLRRVPMEVVMPVGAVLGIATGVSFVRHRRKRPRSHPQERV